MPTLNELLASIATLNPDPKEFATALQTTFQPGFQEAFDRGHKTKATAAKKDLDAANKTIEEKDAEIAKLNDKVEAAGKGNADIEKVRADYRKEIADLKAAHTKEREADAKKFADATTNRAVAELQRMYEAAGMFEIHAKAQAEANRALIRPKADGSFEVLKEAGSDVAIQPADGKSETALRAMVDAEGKKLPKEMFKSGVGKGAGSKTEETGASKGGGNYAERIRQRRQAEAEKKKEQGPKGATPLLERMGISKPA